ncbi:MAG: VOC family protein [Hyphomonadaceae bacterium]|nr:VOC family protein [Hyphomonadaceae bacterium]
MPAIGYVCLGTNDFERACAFYDALSAELGGKRLFPTPHGQMYRLGSGAMLMVTRPYNQEAQHPGNGNMIAINVDGQQDVARIHQKALSLGAVSEGEPGPRGAFGDFAYFRDPDGNKLCVFWSERGKK